MLDHSGKKIILLSPLVLIQSDPVLIRAHLCRVYEI